jgi:hypothetical protein
MNLVLLKYAVLIATFGSGFILVGYEDHARMRGWPVGALLAGDAPPMKLLAFACMLVSVIVAFFSFSWWSPLVVIGIGFVAAFAISEVLKSWVQFLAMAGAVAGFILSLLWVL